VSVVSLWELAVARQEQDLQEKEEEIDNELERERMELESHSVDLSTREAATEAEHECLWKMCEDLYNRKLSISFQEGTLASRSMPWLLGRGSWPTRRSD
jgi:hypothetical protein